MAQNQKLFRIGDLARLFHVGVDSIRYYEKVGLLHPVRGEENNYRLYTLDDVRTMNTIRELLELGFHTDEILRFEKDRNLHHVADMLKKESDVIDREMAELKAKKKISRPVSARYAKTSAWTVPARFICSRFRNAHVSRSPTATCRTT